MAGHPRTRAASPVGLVAGQLASLNSLRTGLLHASAAPTDAFAEPDEAAGTRRAARAAARAYTQSAFADHCLGEVMELVLAAQGQPPTQIALQHTQWLYRDAARSLTSASRHLRQHVQLPRIGRARRQVGEPVPKERGAAARLSSSLRLPFRKGSGADRTDSGPPPRATRTR
ncbi:MULTISPECIES: hypothetical protein [unclassified Kitasatospora]|uniref:hypothetical protein n=1 Tax=unclassified Kitasatospora TaxID=2633591 RepID=UPI00070CB47E|nr:MULTISPECIES: hypothetical protein [unclassified Kitasatospora]KQV20929.1 hypothetical protein ASC99_20715 [Kitasatospora sp. Root107]KRB60417.1 hypothetical protein ASE03_12465 [Kitasatospora sp. Root187]